MAILAVAAAAYFPKHSGGPRESGASPRPGHTGGPPTPVAVENVTQGDFPIYLSGLGSVAALRTVTVRTRVDGELIRVAFTEGQTVRQGDLLAEIDPRPFQVQLRQAEGQLARDEALLKNAEIDLARDKALVAQDYIAKQEAMTQESLVKQYRGNVEIDRAQVDNAKLQLSYARITAPISGRVGLRLVDQGNIIHASDAGGLAVITQIQPIAVTFTLPEDDLPAVMKRWNSEKGIPVEAYNRSGNSKLANGQLVAVDNQIDATTGTIKLKAQFANEDRALFSNQFVNIRMKLDTLPSSILVSTAAIQRGASGSFVYVVNDDGTVTVRPITQGPVDGEKTAVLDGLSPGEAVVVDGADKLREGAKVEIIRGKSAGERQAKSIEPLETGTHPKASDDSDR